MGKILLCVTGSIALRNTLSLIELLVARQHKIQTLLTKSAQDICSHNTILVENNKNHPKSFLFVKKIEEITGKKCDKNNIANCFIESIEKLTQNQCFKSTSVSEEYKKSPEKITHIELSRVNDLILIAPATANIIEKIASGSCNTLLSLTIAASKKDKIVIAPAMNPVMWTNPANKKNIKTLNNNGIKILPPRCDKSASGEIGIGSMMEIEQIVENVEKILSEKQNSSKINSNSLINNVLTNGFINQFLTKYKY